MADFSVGDMMSAMRSDRFSGAHVVAHAPLSPKELCHRVGRVAICLRAQKADRCSVGGLWTVVYGAGTAGRVQGVNG
ncbi:hypothetical protein BKM88_05220 [Anaplasma marginale]|nr:hypothetical protein BKM88_05220 [Anaplasma marginale]